MNVLLYLLHIIINIPKTCSMPKFLSDSEMEKKSEEFQESCDTALHIDTSLANSLETYTGIVMLVVSHMQNPVFITNYVSYNK